MALRILWDDPDDPDGNIEHLADHDLTIDDIEHVLADPESEGTSRSTGLPVAWGYVMDGRYVIVVYEKVAEETVRVITAYEVPEPADGD